VKDKREGMVIEAESNEIMPDKSKKKKAQAGGENAVRRKVKKIPVQGRGKKKGRQASPQAKHGGEKDAILRHRRKK